MLVLTRKRNEMITIGDQITIKIIHTAKGSVKIGIEAPRNMRVLRAELAEEVKSVATDGDYASDEDEAELEFNLDELPILGDQFPVAAFLERELETVA